jgi:hypothetical protein
MMATSIATPDSTMTAVPGSGSEKLKTDPRVDPIRSKSDVANGGSNECRVEVSKVSGMVRRLCMDNRHQASEFFATQHTGTSGERDSPVWCIAVTRFSGRLPGARLDRRMASALLIRPGP